MIPPWCSGWRDSRRGRVGTLARPMGGHLLREELRAIQTLGATLLVSALTLDETYAGLTDEPKLARSAGLDFQSFPILDRGVPEDPAAALKLFRLLASRVREGEGVAVHCWGGIGRSTLVAAGTLVQLGWNPERALEAIGLARGLPVPDTPDQREWILRLCPPAEP